MYNPELCLRREVKLLSHIRLFVIPWTVAHQAPPFMKFSSEEYWSGLPFPSPGDLSDPGIEPGYPTLQTDAYCLSLTIFRKDQKYRQIHEEWLR